jgi:pimeloyl-ACP methyl ester carboxylesterase
MSLYVDESGTAGAPSIVFLHGIGASGWMWWRQTAALADFHCLNVDLPGHGKSNHSEWVSLADTADQIAALIQSRAANGRAHIVGLSLGGYVALLLLERHTVVVDRVVVSGLTAAPMPNRAWLNPQLWLMSVLMRRRWYMNMQARALGLPPAQQAAFTENWLAMSMRTYRRIYEEAVDYSVSPALRYINNPTLVTAGGRESKIILQAVDVISKLMPNAQGRLAPGLGHGWNVEAPDLFNAMARAWISSLPLPEGLQAVRDAGTT